MVGFKLMPKLAWEQTSHAYLKNVSYFIPLGNAEKVFGVSDGLKYHIRWRIE